MYAVAVAALAYGLVADESTSSHLWDFRCNSLSYRPWGYLNVDVSQLQDVRIKGASGMDWSRVLGDIDDNVELMSSPRSLVATEFGSVWLGLEHGGSRDIWVTILDGFPDMFQNGWYLTKAQGEPWYKFTNFDPWSLYKSNWEEATFVFLRGITEPTDLQADDRYLVFTTPYASNTTEIYLFDIWRKAKISLDTPSNAFAVKAYVVGWWVVHGVWNVDTKTSQVLIHYLDTGDSEPLAHSSIPAYAGRLWNATGNEGVEAMASVLVAPSFADLMLYQSNETVDVLPATVGSTDRTVVYTFTLPGLERCVIPPSVWQLDGYRFLRGVMGGGLWLFLSVSNDIGGFAVVAVFGCHEEVFVIPESRTTRTVKLIEGTKDGVVANIGSEGIEYWTFKIYGKTGSGRKILTCKTFDGTLLDEVGEIATRDDVVMYKRLIPDDGRVSLWFMDLDKDNDRVWDLVDGIPLSHRFTNDSDNDGIGDEGDIITDRASCSNHQRYSPGSCVNDLIILYAAWGVFSFFLIISCLLVGVYRKRHRESLYHEKKSYYDEWVNRQWRETTRENCSEEELFAAMAELDDKIQRASGLRGEMIVQSFLFLLTLLSVGLWVASMWEKGGLSISVENTMAWIDFFTSTVFFVDLLYRWIFRDEGEYKDFSDYCFQNWYDFPSLISDIPGVTTAGALSILVVARLVRVLRILKMFRVVRLYHRVTQQQAVLGLILRYDNVWQAIFICGLIVTLGIIIKLVEQEEQEVFGKYENVLWFCIVTVTTIGYGDMVPTNPISRVLAVFLMVSGIGIIGVLTASMGESVRFSGVDKDMMFQRMKKMQQGKWRLSLEYLRNSVMYNPVLAIFKPYQRGFCAHSMCTRPSPILNDIDDVAKMTYKDYKFHSCCFRCAGCGKSISGLEGPCWVVADSRIVTPLSMKKRKRSVQLDTESSPHCLASVYLHKLCLRKARGDILNEDEDSISQTSEETSMDPDTRAQYIRKEDIIVEEVVVSGLARGAIKLNGSYTRRPSVHGDGQPFYDHTTEPAIITKEENKWKLILVDRSPSSPVNVCHGVSLHLLGVWKPGEDPCCGLPAVEDAGVQLHYWHKMYDSLDLPVRTLIVNYASQRTKQQFTALLDAMNSSTYVGGGKFSGREVDRKGMEHAAQMERIRYQIKVVTELEEKRTCLRLPCEPCDKLSLVLRTYKLYEQGKVKNYALMKDHLEYLIFYKSATQAHGTTLAKVFSIAAALDVKDRTDGRSEITNWGNWDEDEYDWNDSVEWTLSEMDRCLTEHEVDKLPEYNAVRIELEHLVLSYDRVLMCQWAWDHLSWKKWEERAERPLRQTHNTTEMPDILPERQQYCPGGQDLLLDPLADDLERHQLEAGKELAASSLISTSAVGMSDRLSRRSTQRLSQASTRSGTSN